ncbi:hypothetical protein cypCar_00032957 [Cyprinus carpio]|nr:hypothetical protein cypCar_00032957 [Cyprinus carpio]
MQVFLLLFLSEILLLRLTSATTLKGQRQNMRVSISAVGDTIVFKFFQPHVDTRLEGYILGYGSSMFSKQFIQLPEDGQPYETEIDAEPKYLIAVQSKNPEEPKKKCAVVQEVAGLQYTVKRKVDLEKPLNIVIGSVTQSSVLLSWGTLMISPFMDTVLDDCFDEGQFTVRYREKEPSNTWNYQTCPSTSTVIDNLKPDALYEFAVRADTDTNSGVWSPAVIHNTADQIIEPFKELNQAKPKKPLLASQQSFLPPVPVLSNINQTRAAPLLIHTSLPKQRKTSDLCKSASVCQLVPSQRTNSYCHSQHLQMRCPIGMRLVLISELPRLIPIQSVNRYVAIIFNHCLLPIADCVCVYLGRGIFPNSSPVFHPMARNATHKLRPRGRVPPVPPKRFFRPTYGYRNSTVNKKREHHQRLWRDKSQKRTKEQHVKTMRNQVSKTKEKEKVTDLKQMDPVPDMKPLAPPTIERPAKKRPSSTTTPQSVFEGSRFDTVDNSSVFSSHPLSEVDATGKKRFVAPHVIYRTDKRPEEPCSVTRSLSFFPDEEVGNLNVTGPPKSPPSNLTVVTVEGCPSFIILDWDKTDNETTEYEVVSSTKGPHGEKVSIQTTNQTHTTVQNLTPESSYEFKVTPKNELGSGPASEPVTFSTESADPRVSQIQTGKNAIWSSFPFKADSYSECNGQQFIKRTWYRKFVGIQLCNSLRYKIYLSDALNGKFYSIGDQTGYGEDHCQFVDSFLDGRTGGPLSPNQLPPRKGFYRAMRQEPVKFGEIGGNSMINYVAWYECGIPIPGKW